MWVTQSCLTLYNPMDHSLPGSSIHGILQVRVLEWVAISFSRGSSQPRDWTQISHIAGRLFTIRATREALLILYFPLIKGILPPGKLRKKKISFMRTGFLKSVSTIVFLECPAILGLGRLSFPAPPSFSSSRTTNSPSLSYTFSLILRGTKSSYGWDLHGDWGIS